MKTLLPSLQCQPQTPFKDFITSTLFTYVDEIYQLFRWELIVPKENYHLSNSKIVFFQSEQ